MNFSFYIIKEFIGFQRYKCCLDFWGDMLGQDCGELD